MAINIKWRGDEILTKIIDSADDNIEAAASILATTIKENMSQINFNGNNPSSPGNFPAVVTNTLRTGIRSEVNRKLHAARTGTNVSYAPELEMIKNRPFMKLGLKLSRAKIKRVFRKKLK